MGSENTMAESDGDVGAYKSAPPTIHSIGPGDLRDALVKGLQDFEAMPTHVIFLCLIYPIVTLVFARAYAGYEMLPLLFPLLAGYTLLGPIVATGMYELSRRREQGLDTSRRKAFHVLQRHATRSVGLLALVLMAIYVGWMVTAVTLWNNNFGDVAPESVEEFLIQVFLTPAGWRLMVVGGGVGFAFATVVFTVSVVSFPLLMDRDLGIMLAVQTSIRAVFKNPVTMGMWAFVVAFSMLIGSLPFFVGLAVVLPVLGHATWHVYRKVVEL